MTTNSTTVGTSTLAAQHHCRDGSVVFHKTREAFGGLSNMAAGFPLCIGEVKIRTSEALYQACRFPCLPHVQALILAEKSPMAAKMVSKPHRAATRNDWDDVRVEIMRWCLEVKLVQHKDCFGALLLSTGDRPIVEQSHKDRFWGAVLSKDGDWLEGANVLGRQLTDLRERLRSHPDAFSRVEPPNVGGMLLLGRPIETVF